MDTTRLRGHRRRSLATALVATLVASSLSLATGTPGAGAQTDGATPAEAASTWLTTQFVDGERLESTFDGGATFFPDQGLTIDGIFALAATGTGEGTAADATAWLERQSTYDSYIGSGGNVYAGATAKLALLALVRGLDPTSFGEGGIDLLTRLEGQENGDGRFVDTDAMFGDFSNVFGQSFAIIALERAGGFDPSPASVELLLESQCDDGGFTNVLEPDTCTSEVDATAMALFALLAVGGEDAEVADAVSYLLGVQNDDGGFDDDGAANANATGLASAVLRLAGEDAAADDGVAFISSLQLGCDDAETDRGAIDTDGGEFDGFTAARATTQAVLGLTGANYATLTGESATDALPVFDCPEPTTTTTTTEPTDDVDESDATGTPQPTPAATPVQANPSFTG